MDPTTNDRTTWKHWAAALAALLFAAIGMPLIVSLPTTIAITLTLIIAAAIIAATMTLARSTQ